MVGQEGLFYFYPEIQDPPPNDKFAIGDIGRAVTWDDVLTTFKAVARNRKLVTHFYDQGQYVWRDFTWVARIFPSFHRVGTDQRINR